MSMRIRGLLAALAVSGLTAVLGVSGAVAASPPSAVTGTASQITATTATVAGTVNPSGQATTYDFQYGPTTNYGSQTATTSAGSGTTATAEKATLTGLVSNSTYHFRIVATSPSGTSVGTDATFTTAKAPPVVTTVAPSLVTSDGATLNGNVNPNGKAATYVFEYGPTTSYGFQTPTTSAGTGTASTSVHASVSGLLAGTTYHYRVVATNADGATATADATFQTTGTPANPSGPLPAISSATAVNISAHSVQLNGAINPQGPTTRWYFQFGLSSYYGLQTSTQTISGTGARPVNVQINGLQSGSTYHYRLVAYSNNGLYVGPDHTFATKHVARSRPVLRIYAAAHRASREDTIAIHGRLQLPASVPTNAACNGTIALQLNQGNTTVALRHVQVHGNCAFAVNVHVTASRIHTNRALSLTGYYWGNTELLPTSHGLSLHI